MDFGGRPKFGRPRGFGPRGPRPLNIGVPRCKPITNFNYGRRTKPFMNDVMKTIVRQPDFTGIGGHGFKKHGSHGTHRQTSIGFNAFHTNFRYGGKPGGDGFKPRSIGPRPFRLKKF